MDYFDDYSIYVDGGALTIVLISTLFAIYRGLVKEALGLGSWILAAIAVIYLVPASRPLTESMFDSKVTADAVTGIVIAIVVLVICTLITYKSTTKIRGSALNGLDRTLGAFFGLARGLIIVIIIYSLASLVLAKELAEEAEYSLFRPTLEKVGNSFKEYVEDYGKEETNLDDLFRKLNEPEVKAETNESSGYKEKERQSLDRLVVETSSEEKEAEE